MDEPLRRARQEAARADAARDQAAAPRLGMSIIYVTHDQEEALVMSDRIGVFNRGRLEQVGHADRARTSARSTRFVAEFIGESNIVLGGRWRTAEGGFSGTRDGGWHHGCGRSRRGPCRQDRGAAVVSVRPERIALQSARFRLRRRAEIASGRRDCRGHLHGPRRANTSFAPGQASEVTEHSRSRLRGADDEPALRDRRLGNAALARGGRDGAAHNQHDCRIRSDSGDFR